MICRTHVKIGKIHKFIGGNDFLPKWIPSQRDDRTFKISYVDNTNDLQSKSIRKGDNDNDCFT